jgi:periplasmic divalent cation tolerance protein
MIAILTTVDSKECAGRIARALVEQKLAACVQISAIDSVYTWDSEVQESPEFRLLAKTTDERYPEVEDTIRMLHTYDLPAIVGFPLPRAYAPYADWVEENSSGIGRSAPRKPAINTKSGAKLCPSVAYAFPAS